MSLILREAVSVYVGMCWKLCRFLLFEDAIHIEFFGDEIDRIMQVDVLTGEIKASLNFCDYFSGFALCCAAGTD